jgi:hypothetical protein
MSVPNHTPTPEEIEAECAKLQDGWTDVERRRAEGKTAATDDRIDMTEFSDFNGMMAIRPWRKEL